MAAGIKLGANMFGIGVIAGDGIEVDHAVKHTTGPEIY